MTENPTLNPVKYVILGGGIAGVSAAEAVHKADPQAEITLVCGEELPPYFRMNLTRYLAGEVEAEKLPLHPDEWYLSNHISLLLGTRATGIDTGNKTVTLQTGMQLPYDRLILALGASPMVPKIVNSDMPGVQTLRVLADANDILREAEKPIEVVCIGGGLLGLEVAGAIAHHGPHVTVVEFFDRLLPRQLDAAASAVLQGKIKKMGIDMVLGAVTREMVGDGHVSAVELEDGRRFPADLVVISAGVIPNLELPRQAGLATNRGVIVDDHMRASAPDVYAAGDIAEHNGRVYGLWVPSKAMGTVAGQVAAGLEAAFAGDPPSARLKVLGVDVFSVGEFLPKEPHDFVIARSDEENYTGFTFRDGKMIGAVLVGDAGKAPAAKKAVDNKKDFAGIMAESTVEDVLAAL